MDQLVGAQSQAKVAKKMQKHPHLRRSPQQTPNQKQKNVFSLSTRKLAESVEGLYSSLALAAGWRFMAKKGRANLLARAVVKGALITCISNTTNHKFFRLTNT